MLINKIKKLFSNRWFLYSLGLLVLIFFASQYILTTRFPIGDDPAGHIMAIRSNTFDSLWHLTYPIPLVIFKWLHNILPAIPVERLFVYLISFFWLLGALAMYLFTSALTKNKVVAFTSACIFILGGWVSDGISTGYLAESLGWAVLLFAFYALIKRNIWLTLLLTLSLVFIHPFAFFVFAIVAPLYLLFSLFSKEIRTKKFSIITLSIFIAGLIAALIFEKSMVDKFLNFAVENFSPSWGQRRLWVVLTTGNERRILVTLFALVGVLISIKDWAKTEIKIVYLLAFVGLFLSMSQIFGIGFLVYRFYPYLEMGLAVFAALGIWHVADILSHRKQIFLALILAVVVLIPHYVENGKTIHDKAYNAKRNDSMTLGDQAAFVWIDQNVVSSDIIYCSYKRAFWLHALGQPRIITSVESAALPQLSDSEFARLAINSEYKYLYYNENVDGIPANISDYYRLAYDKDGVKIYEKN